MPALVFDEPLPPHTVKKTVSVSAPTTLCRRSRLTPKRHDGATTLLQATKVRAHRPSVSRNFMVTSVPIYALAVDASSSQHIV